MLLSDHSLQGTWYEFEITPVKQSDFQIHTVLKKSKDGKKSFVSWRGFEEDKYNSWVRNKDIKYLGKGKKNS